MEKIQLIAQLNLILTNIKEETYYVWVKDDLELYISFFEGNPKWLTFSEFDTLSSILSNAKVIPDQNKTTVTKLIAKNKGEMGEILDINNSDNKKNI